MAEGEHIGKPAGTSTPGHEPSDLKPRTILIFGISLSVTILICLAVANWMFHYFTAVQTESSAPLSPLARQEAPPGPRLQAQAPEDLRKFRAEEEATLTTYGWVNQQAGIVRIPIDRAMQLLAERGLPTPGTPATPPATAAPTPAPAAPVSMAAQGEKLFHQFGCSACHLPNGKGVGPSLLGVYGKPVKLTTGQTLTVNDAFLHEHILTPEKTVPVGYPPIMPPFKGRVSAEQLAQLIAYIKSLASQTPPK